MEQWAEEEAVERERELAEMTGWLEQVAALEEKRGSSVHGSESESIGV